MRVVVQRCREAQVNVAGEMVGAIGPGLMLLVGVTHEDTEQDAAYLAEKIAGLRIFEDEAGKMNLAVTEI
ncbi:MAG: D-aminoacyl-tRNA deacylase, partial [Paenibacillaceae bacterium]|nr:D-aminoacyl-tRNA deacylase [Paenibacillaceae bacterium]